MTKVGKLRLNEELATGTSLPDQTGNNGKFLSTNGTVASWTALAGGGDMLASTYDPTGVSDDAFSMDNMIEGTSTKIMTSAERTKLSGIATGAEVNVNADWNASSGDAQILNKPTIPTISDTAYDATSWDNNTDAPSKNAVRDKIETLAPLTSPSFTTPNLGTPSAGTLTNCTSLPISGLTASTATALGVGSIELGHASDTTIARVSAGLVSIEGKTILTNTSTAGVGNTPTASGTVQITHGLGRTPTMIRIYSGGGFTANAAATPTTYSIGIWNSSGNFCMYQGINGTSTINAATSNTFAIYMITSAGNLISGVIQNVGATTFDIVFTETGTHTRGVYMWEAQ